MEPSLTGWSLSLLCEASPRCPPSSWSSPTSPLVTWQQCNVRCLFSLLPLLLLSPPSAGLPRAVQASTCKQGRNRGAARAQDHPQEHRLGPGRRLNIQPWLHLGSAPTGCETPAKGTSSSDLMVCVSVHLAPRVILHMCHPSPSPNVTPTDTDREIQKDRDTHTYGIVRTPGSSVG